MHVVEAEDAVRIGVLGAKVTVEPRVEAAAEDVVHHPHRKDVGRGGGDAHFSDPDLRLRRAWLVDQGHHARRGLRPPGTNRRGLLAVLPRRESLLEQRQEGSRVGVADHEQGRVGRLEPRPVPGDEVLAGDGLHRAGRALARITPGMLLAEDHAREHVLSHRLRIVEGLRDLAEPLDPDALDVGVPELRIEGDVREDFQHWIEGIGERRHRDPRGVRPGPRKRGRWRRHRERECLRRAGRGRGRRARPCRRARCRRRSAGQDRWRSAERRGARSGRRGVDC